MFQRLKDKTLGDLYGSTEFRRVLGNTGWITLERALRLLVGFFLTAWLARYLGPHDFGALNLAIAIVAMWGSIGQLGLKSIIVRDLVNDTQARDPLIGTSYCLQTLGAAATVPLAFTSTLFVSDSSTMLPSLTLIIAGTAFFKATDAFKYWFESQIASKPIVWVESLAFTITSLTKLYLIKTEATLTAFAYTFLLEAAIVALGVTFTYNHLASSLKKLSFHLATARYLLQQGWPLMLTSLAIMIYMRIDQIMIAAILGPEATGLYSATVKLSELWFFIPIAAVSSAFPAILKHRSTDLARYQRQLIRLYRILILLAIAVAALVTLLAPIIIETIFGSDYLPANHALKIHIWSGLFVALGIISSQWLVAEKLQKLALYRTLSGALLNIVLNVLLIPEFGLTGAALATLIAQSWSALWFDITSKKTHASFNLKIQALRHIHRF